MSLFRFKIVLVLLVFFVTSCSQGVRLFRPRIECKYPADYGVIYSYEDTLKGGFGITYISYLDSDTVSFDVKSYLSSTLFYIKGYSGIAYMDSTNILRIRGISGSNLMSVQFAWPMRMLVYDNDASELWGMTRDSAPKLVNFDLPDMSTNFSLELTDYDIDTQIYFLDPVNKIYYFGAKSNDTLWLLGVSAAKRGIIYKNVLSTAYLGVKYNYWTNLAVGLAFDGQSYYAVGFSLQDMEEKYQSVLEQKDIMASLLNFDYAGQNLVVGHKSDTAINLLYIEPSTGQIKEIHNLKDTSILDCVVWSSMHY